MPYDGGARLHHLLASAEALEPLAKELAARLRRRLRPAPVPRGATLRPGLGTPLWLAVVAAMRPHLTARGARARLAHELGVHRSQVSKYFTATSAMPDAERALRLLVWLARRRRRRVAH
jgi:hypothetical protein